MARKVAAIKIFDGVTVTTAATQTSSAVDIQEMEAIALHLTSITGTTPLVTFTYSVAPTLNGPFTVPSNPVTIGASVGAADVLAFEPEAAGAIKFIATNAGTGPIVITAYSAVIEAA